LSGYLGLPYFQAIKRDSSFYGSEPEMEAGFIVYNIEYKFNLVLGSSKLTRLQNEKWRVLRGHRDPFSHGDESGG
jgi:hypothetical protein